MEIATNIYKKKGCVAVRYAAYYDVVCEVIWDTGERAVVCNDDPKLPFLIAPYRGEKEDVWVYWVSKNNVYRKRGQAASRDELGKFQPHWFEGAEKVALGDGILSCGIYHKYLLVREQNAWRVWDIEAEQERAVEDVELPFPLNEKTYFHSSGVICAGGRVYWDRNGEGVSYPQPPHFGLWGDGIWYVSSGAVLMYDGYRVRECVDLGWTGGVDAEVCGDTVAVALSKGFVMVVSQDGTTKMIYASPHARILPGQIFYIKDGRLHVVDLREQRESGG